MDPGLPRTISAEEGCPTSAAGSARASDESANAIDSQRLISEMAREIEELRRQLAAAAASSGRAETLEAQSSTGQTPYDWQQAVDLFSAFVRSVDDVAIFLLDVDGRIVTWNRGAERLKGYSSQEIVGRHFSCLYTPESLDCGLPQQAITEARECGHYEGEGLRVRKDGSRFWASVVLSPVRDPQGEIRGYLKVTSDISDRKHAEQKAHSMVELAVNAMVMVDSQGKIVLVNAQTEKMFGYPRDELIGELIELLIPARFQGRHPGFRDTYFESPVVRAMGAGRELYARRKDGSEFPVEIGLNPIENDEGAFVLGSVVDITERRQAEARSRLHLAELAHVARLSTVGEWFSELAHEINQPLGAATNYARACVRYARSGEGATKEQLIDWMEKTAAQTTRACEIVRRLGVYVKKHPSTRESIDINALVKHVVALTVLDVPGTLEMTRVAPTLNLDPSIPELCVDRVQIEQVLVNLVRNAVEAMRNTPAAKKTLRIITRKLPDMIQVEVEDSGCGIPPADLSRLFDPFFTTKAEGMGLGLSISQSIIQAHDGRLWADSKEGQGTTFAFTLPIKTFERASS